MTTLGIHIDLRTKGFQTQIDRERKMRAVQRVTAQEGIRKSKFKQQPKYSFFEEDKGL